MKILLQGIAQLILPLLIGLVFLECKKDESVKFYQEIEILKTNPMDEQAPMHHSAPPVSDACRRDKFHGSVMDLMLMNLSGLACLLLACLPRGMP